MFQGESVLRRKCLKEKVFEGESVLKTKCFKEKNVLRRKFFKNQMV